MANGGRQALVQEAEVAGGGLEVVVPQGRVGVELLKDPGRGAFAPERLAVGRGAAAGRPSVAWRREVRWLSSAASLTSGTRNPLPGDCRSGIHPPGGDVKPRSIGPAINKMGRLQTAEKGSTPR